MTATDVTPLTDYASQFIEQALARGEEVADGHVCGICEPCPQCVPIHGELLRLGTADTVLSGLVDDLNRAIAARVPQYLGYFQQAHRDAQLKAIVRHGEWRAAQQRANSLGAALPPAPSYDTSRISRVPREGWMPIELAAGLTLWLLDPADEADARQLASSIASAEAAQRAYQQAVDAAHVAEQASAQAERVRVAAERALRAAEDEVQRWIDDQVGRVGDSLRAWKAEHARLSARFDRCLAECRGEHVPDDGPSLLRLVLGALGLAAGTGMVVLGQPFDAGSTPSPAQVGVEDALGQLELETVPVDPRFRTSFFAEPLDELGLFPGVLGEPIEVTGIGVGTLVFTEPILDPVAELLGGLPTRGDDVTIAPTGSTGVPEEAVVVIGLEFDGDVLAPSFCDGRMIQFATSINNPAVAGLYTDVGPFVGDYGQGANTILRQEITDCGSAANVMDITGDAFAFDGSSGAGGWLTTGDDGATNYLGLVPVSILPPDGSFRTVFFEVESGGVFEFDNTRYQSTPDDLTEMLAGGGWPTAAVAIGPTESPVEDPDETDPALTGLGLLSGVLGGATLAGGGSRPTGSGRREEDAESSGDAGESGPPVGSDLPAVSEADAIEATTAARTELLDTALRRVREAATVYAEFAESRATSEAAADDRGLLGWMFGPSDDAKRQVSQATRHEAQALDAYRTAIAEFVAAGLLTVAPGDRGDALDALAQTLRDETELDPSDAERVRSVIELDESDARRRGVLAVVRAQLTIASVAQEAVDLASTRLDPVGLRSDQPALVAALNRLEASIVSTAADRRHRAGQSEAAHLARAWFRDTRRTLAMDSIVVLSEHGTLATPDGQIVQGTLRRQFVADQLTTTAEDLDAAAWRRHDTRSADAAKLRHHLREVYSALDFLGNGDADPTEYFRAVSAAIRQRQTEVNQWFVADYLGLPVDDGGSWWDVIEVGWSVRLGTQGRTRGLGENSIEVVRDRVHRMNLEADRAVELLDAAASTPPAALDPNDLEALRDLGYVTADASGDPSYRIPVVDTTAPRVTRIDKPGASWLDVVSVQNASEILLSVAVPELAAVRMSAIAARLGLSGRAIIATRVATDQVVGLGTDVGVAALHGTGDASLARVAAESLVTSWAGVLANKGTDVGVKQAFAREDVRRFFADPVRRATVQSWTATTMGIGTDTLINLIGTAAAGEGVSQDDLLAALTASVMNRAVGSVGQRTASAVEDGIARLPRSIREASLVLAPTMDQAGRVDAQLDAAADARFAAVSGDRPLNRALGSRVFEALRLGDLSWSDLQRVYTARGKSLDLVMDQVRIERDRFVQSIVVRARGAAITQLNGHYDRAVAATQDPAERSRLEGERRAELDKIDPTEGHDASTTSHFAREALKIMSSDRDELLKLHGRSIGEPAGRSLDQLREAAIEQLVTDVIQPGSAGATSDIDRSWASEWLRRGANTVMHAEMIRGRSGDTPPPTTATAFDTNEYVNVMRRISDIVAVRSEYRDLPVTDVRVVVGDTVTEVQLTHAQTVEANSLAAAMLHMHEGQRSMFESNLKAGATAERRTELEAMFVHAHNELDRSDEALRRYTKAEATEQGTSVSDPDTQLRARDRLYGERMAALDAIGARIDAATPGSPERAALMSEFELGMNRALRDGIETYTDMANLDIIVSRMQSAKTPDGRKLSPEELMRAPEFSIGDDGDLAHLTERQIRSMFNDQVLMIMHHVGAYRSGHESAAKATRSLAKYAERAMLAMNLMGRFDPDRPGAHGPLFQATRTLMQHKDDPKALLDALVAAAPRGTGSVAEALHWYLGQIETLPGLDGLTRGPAFGVDTSGYSSSIATRDWAARAGRDDDVVSDYVTTLGELHRLEVLQAFAPSDRFHAENLLQSIRNLELRQGWVVAGSGEHMGDHRRSITDQLRHALQELDDLRSRGGGTDPDPAAEVVETLRRRAEVLADRVAAVR